MDDCRLTDAFAAAMGGLGPFEPAPRLAVAVSGGADSSALALLSAEWATKRGGSVLALVADHGLRTSSADEARITVQRLAAQGIPARLLTITGLPRGPALAERARIERYRVLSAACRDAGILHLLLGHHELDQIETVAMRILRGSQDAGLACMPALRETAGLRLLRPLLAIGPETLRGFLADRGMAWAEDPSNRDIRALRPRLRQPLSAAPRAPLLHAIAHAGARRAMDDEATARELARRATIRPEGFALLSPGRMSEAALSRLVQAIGGAAYPPSPTRIAALARSPGPATLAGVRIMPAGRSGDGFLVLREQAAIAARTPASDGLLWDGRFRIAAAPPGTDIGALGDDAVRFRQSSDLSSAILRTLPAFRSGQTVEAVPHLGYTRPGRPPGASAWFCPPLPPGGAPFVAAATCGNS
jgi:tRNA(Ile)-lysidine synthase